jgi:hypothetical protein
VNNAGMQLKTVDEVIRALGGTAAAAKALDVGPPAISNWKARNLIPSRVYLVIGSLLKRQGHAADKALFAFKSKRR